MANGSEKVAAIGRPLFKGRTERASGIIHIRVTESEKDRIKRAASKRGKTVGAFLRGMGLAAADRDAMK